MLFFLVSLCGCAFAGGRSGSNEAYLKELVQKGVLQKEQSAFLVAINPGYGRVGQGNGSLAEERKITFAVAAALEELFAETDVGLFVMGEEKKVLSWEELTNVVKEVDPDLVIGLHVNVDEQNKQQFGTSVVYDETFYFPKLTNVRFADLLEREVVTTISGKANGIFPDEEKQYPLLGKCGRPAISIELGYLSHGQEGKLLQNKQYRGKLALGISQGIWEARKKLEDGRGLFE